MAYSYTDALPDAVRHRALAAESGRRWIANLDATVASLVRRWDLRVGNVLHGGTESLVLEVERGDGTEAVLKLGISGVADLAGEARAYELAEGRGLATVYGCDIERNALLIERLGPMLADSGWSLEHQMHAICRALAALWRTPVDDSELLSGGDKALWLADFIEHIWHRLDGPCDLSTRNTALDFAAERGAAHAPENSVLVHGDAHANNALKVPGSGDGPDGQCKLIDPDGMFAERACDLAVPMREWSAALRPAPVRLARERCSYLAEFSGAGERAIWQWGFMERVSSGMLLVEIGLEDEGWEMLAIADRLADASVGV